MNAAAVIGSQFGAELTAVLVGDTALSQLVQAELIDQVKFTPRAEYVFRHPLIRTVAYESQLKADRATLHSRLSTEIEQRDPGSADENAALIAEHLEAAGDLHAAYAWHMRAGTWSTNRESSPHTRAGVGQAMSLIVYLKMPGSGWLYGSRRAPCCAQAHFASGAVAPKPVSTNSASCAMTRETSVRWRSE